MPTEFTFDFPIFGAIGFAKEPPRAERVIFNGPATVLFWDDGGKTVVKLRDGDADDREKAIMAAMLKRLHPNFQDFLRDALEVDDD